MPANEGRNKTEKAAREAVQDERIRTDGERIRTDNEPLAPETVAPGGDQGGTAYRYHSLVTPRTAGSADMSIMNYTIVMISMNINITICK